MTARRVRLMTNNPNKVNAFDKWHVLYRVDEEFKLTSVLKTFF